MPYTYTLTSVIPATAEEIYQAWLDSLAHSAMTGGEASMSDEVGAEVSAWDGYITGRNLELVPGERIVQSWRTGKFTDGHEDSTITLTFEELDDGTLLTLVHSNVPDEQRNYEEGGWESNYFEPMKAYFANLRGAANESGSEPAAVMPPAPVAAEQPHKKRRRATATAPKKKAKRAAARGKPSRAAKRQTARPGAAKSRRKAVKSSARKTAKRTAAKKKKPAGRKRARR